MTEERKPRGQEEIPKRMLVHAAAFNLGLLMRRLCGFGTRAGAAGSRRGPSCARGSGYHRSFGGLFAISRRYFGSSWPLGRPRHGFRAVHARNRLSCTTRLSWCSLPDMHKGPSREPVYPRPASSDDVSWGAAGVRGGERGRARAQPAGGRVVPPAARRLSVERLLDPARSSPPPAAAAPRPRPTPSLGEDPWVGGRDGGGARVSLLQGRGPQGAARPPPPRRPRPRPRLPLHAHRPPGTSRPQAPRR